MSQYPQRIGEPDCRDFLRTGRCKYGDSCKYHHPIGGVKAPLDPNEPPFPIRPDEPPCQYYLKNGTCKFGQTCKFHHPPHILSRSRSSSLGGGMMVGSPTLTASTCPVVPGTSSLEGVGVSNLSGHGQTHGDIGLLLPQRPSEPDCIYFLKHGRCKYGSTCKYHHPANVHVNVNVMTDSHSNTNSRYAGNMNLGQIQNHNNSQRTAHNGHNGHVQVNMSHLYQLSQSQAGDRERSMSSGSLVNNDVRGDLQSGANTLNGSAASAPSIIRVPTGNPYQTAATALQLEQQHSHAFRNMDSVPSSRHEVLDTITNPYHLYPQSHQQQHPHHHQHQHQSIDSPQLSHSRYYNQSFGTGTGTLTPGSGTNGSSGSLNTSPKITSPSPTSSTLASSYDTAISGLEKLPPALLQSQNGPISRNNSGNMISSRKNSIEDGYDVCVSSTTGSVSGSDPINASSHGTARMSNIHHYMQSVHTTTGPSNSNSSNGRRFSSSSSHTTTGPSNNNSSAGRRFSSTSLSISAPEGGDSRFLSEHSSMHSSSSLNKLNGPPNASDQNQNHNRRPPIGNLNGHIGGSSRNTASNNRNVDDGLSMMTSALLTMLDTPREDSQEGGGDGDEFDFEPRGSVQAGPPDNSSLNSSSHNHNHGHIPKNNINLNTSDHSHLRVNEAPSYGSGDMGMNVGLTGTRAGLLQDHGGRGQGQGHGSFPGQGQHMSSTLNSINLPDLGSSRRGHIQPKPTLRQQHQQSQPQSQQLSSQFARNYNFNNINFSDGNFPNYPTTNRDEANGGVNVNGMNLCMPTGMNMSMAASTTTAHNQQQHHLPPSQGYNQHLNLSSHSLGRQTSSTNLNGYNHNLGLGSNHAQAKNASDVPLSPSNPMGQNRAQESAQFWMTTPTTDAATTGAPTQFYLSP